MKVVKLIIVKSILNHLIIILPTTEKITHNIFNKNTIDHNNTKNPTQ